MLRYRFTASLIVAIAAIGFAPQIAYASTAPTGACTTNVSSPVQTSGTHFASNGNNFTIKGVVVPYAKPAFTQVAELQAQGLNTVRLKMPWSQFETDPTHYIGSAWTKLFDDIAQYRQMGVNVILDNHRLGWSPYFGDKPGIPPAFYADGRFPATPAGRAAAITAWWGREAALAQSWYFPFIHTEMNWTACYANVIGYQMWNEPDGVDTQKATHKVLAWESPLLAKMHAWDKTHTRTIFFMLRHGGDMGFLNAHMMKAFFKTPSQVPHTALEFHTYYNGRGTTATGMDPTGNTWLKSWTSTHNQNDTNYNGTKAEQWANFSVTYNKTLKLGIPIFVGEFGAQNADTGAARYCNQMISMFTTHNVSWTYFTLDTSTQFGMLDSSGNFRQDGCTPKIISAF